MTSKNEADSAASPSILTTRIGQPTGEGQDRRLKQNFWNRRRILAIVGGTVVILLIAYAVSTSMGGRSLRVATDRLTISTVEEGPFQEYVPVTGNVLPRTTVYLDAVEGGRIEQIFVLEGTDVTEGQPLLRLSNNDLQLRLIAADAQRLEQINRLQDMQFRMEQNALELRQALTNMDYQIQRLDRQIQRNQPLLERDLVSQEEYDRIADELNYWRRNRSLTLEGYRQDSLRMAVQLAQGEESVGRMEANYGVIQGILGHLTVRAPVSGQLTALNAEIGEITTPGARFGQIDVLDGYRVRAGVDEFYIARVVRGQPATTQPLGNVEYPMEVTRVYPEVRDGSFEVDLEFAGETPAGIRRGQSIRFRLEMSDPETALLLPTGGFFQATGGNWVYVLNDSGEAVRRDIRVGRQNPQFLEVVEGLEPGDRVITSSYDTFGEAERLILN